jgi:hypothetical protein
MKNDKKKINLAISIILLGSLFTIILGYLYKSSSIFITTDPGFQFVHYGICGSILLTLIHVSDYKNFIIGACALLLMTLILFRITSLKIIFIRFIFLAAYAAAIFIYHYYYYNKLIKLPFGKFIPLSALLFIANLILALIYGLFVQELNNREIQIAQALFGFMIGTGIGLGLELTVPVIKLLKIDK